MSTLDERPDHEYRVVLTMSARGEDPIAARDAMVEQLIRGGTDGLMVRIYEADSEPGAEPTWVMGNETFTAEQVRALADEVDDDDDEDEEGSDGDDDAAADR